MVLSGWQTSGIFDRQSGDPSRCAPESARSTATATWPTNTCNTADTTLTGSQLNDVLQFRMTGNGPYFASAGALNASGQAAVRRWYAVLRQIFTTPPAGTIGTLQKRIFSGPWDTTFDFGISKHTRIKERNVISAPHDRAEYLRIIRRSQIADQTATSTTFGKITGRWSRARRVFQFGPDHRLSGRSGSGRKGRAAGTSAFTRCSSAADNLAAEQKVEKHSRLVRHSHISRR